MINIHMYKVYYGILPSLSIRNVIAPGLRHVTGDMDIVSCRKREETQQSYHDRLTVKSMFYERLTRSILKDGIENPIILVAGKCLDINIKYLTKEMREDPSKILICDMNGGSRLWVAQNFKMDVPCIISDYVDRFKSFEELKSPAEAMTKYKKPPIKVEFGTYSVGVYDLPNEYVKPIGK